MDIASPNDKSAAGSSEFMPVAEDADEVGGAGTAFTGRVAGVSGFFKDSKK